MGTWLLNYIKIRDIWLIIGIQCDQGLQKKFNSLVWPLIQVVSRGIVAAFYEGGSAIGTCLHRTTNGGGSTPHHLRIVATHCIASAFVGLIIVAPRLWHPCHYSICTSVNFSATPEEILTIRATRVHELTLTLGSILGGITRSVVGQVLVPREWCHSYAGPSLIMWLKEWSNEAIVCLRTHRHEKYSIVGYR